MRNFEDYIILTLALGVLGVSLYYQIWFLVALIGGILLSIASLQVLFKRQSTDKIITLNQEESSTDQLLIRKYRQVDTERYISTFFRMGLIVAMASVLLAFRWSVPTFENEICFGNPIIEQADGSITNIEILRSPLGSTLGKEAVRVVESMPNWIPGKQRGEPVRVKFNLPINFNLN